MALLFSAVTVTANNQEVEFLVGGIPREFDTIVAVHDKAPNCLVAPCGNCRQMLIEYGPDIKVILNNDDNEIIKVDIKDLIPFAWKPIIV